MRLVDVLLFVALAVFFVLYAIFNLTNISVAAGPILMGFSALCAGIACIAKLIDGRPRA